MFCSGCGTKISANNEFCPNCGKKNENYVESRKKRFNKDDNPIRSNLSLKLLIAIATIAIVTIVALVIIINTIHFIPASKKSLQENSGAPAYISGDGSAVFLVNGTPIKFEGSFKEGRTTPDYSRYILLGTDKRLSSFGTPSDEGIILCEDVDSIDAINNYGVFATVLNKGLKLEFISFKGETISFNSAKSGSEPIYSTNKLSVAQVDNTGIIQTYCVGDKEIKKLCNVADNITLCSVKNNGANAIWYDDNGKERNIYTAVNGVSERIGRFDTIDSYSSIQADYFNDDNSFVVYSKNETSILLSKKGDDPKEISLPGVLGFSELYDENGESISLLNNVKEVYMTIKDNKDSDESSLYRMDLDGNFEEIVSGVNDEFSFKYFMINAYRITNGFFFYRDGDNDFYVKSLREGNPERITTEADAFFISSNGKFAYFVKDDTLYYWDTSDKGHQLISIQSGMTDDNEIMVSESDDVIYYITDNSKIGDTYSEKGVLYRYKVGQDTEKIGSDIMMVLQNDSTFPDPETPVIRKFKEQSGNRITSDYGTIKNGAFEAFATNINKDYN